MTWLTLSVSVSVDDPGSAVTVAVYAPASVPAGTATVAVKFRVAPGAIVTVDGSGVSETPVKTPWLPENGVTVTFNSPALSGAVPMFWTGTVKLTVVPGSADLLSVELVRFASLVVTITVTATVTAPPQLELMV